MGEKTSPFHPDGEHSYLGEQDEDDQGEVFEEEEGWIVAPRNADGNAMVPEGVTTKVDMQTGEVKYLANEDAEEGDEQED